MTIDIHAHLYPPVFLERLTQINSGPLRMTRDGREFELSIGGNPYIRYTPEFYDADLRVEALDRDGVTMQVLTLAPPMVYWADAPLALELSRLTNNHLASVVERYPDRFVAGAVVPLQEPALAAEELRRAVEVGGHRMVLMGSNIQGTQLDDPALEPFYTEVERLDVPIFVHPIRPAGFECMHDYRLDISIGFLSDTTMAATRIALSGILDRHSGLRFCWAHMGGALLWLLDRIEMVRGTLPGSEDNAEHDMETYLRNFFWFDTKVLSHRNLRYGVETVGAERLMFGTDVPFFNDMTATLLDLVRTAGFLDDDQRDAILVGNAQSFLSLS